LGCGLSRMVPAKRLKTVVAAVAIFAGLQLVWNGTHTLLARRAAANVVKVAAQSSGKCRAARPTETPRRASAHISHLEFPFKL
jgi:hypothetical protein